MRFLGPLIAFLTIGSAAMAAQDHAVVLMYHRFGDDRFPSTNIRLDQFDAHLEFLETNGYAVVPLADVVTAIEGGEPLPDRAVAITIDDGFRSVYEHAFPRLRARAYPFTVFVSTDVVDDGAEDFMSWGQMREMAAHGATFANHGASHRSYAEHRSNEDRAARIARLRSDLTHAAERLATELGDAFLSNAFAYPYGEYDELAADVVDEAGCVSFGQHSGPVGRGSDTRRLPRFPMAESYASIGDFAVKVDTIPLPVAEVEPWDPVTDQRRPNITVTLAATDARLERLACYVSGEGTVDVGWIEPGRRFVVGPAEDLPVGRSRVNCTAPSATDDSFHWFGHPWIVR